MKLLEIPKSGVSHFLKGGASIVVLIIAAIVIGFVIMALIKFHQDKKDNRYR